MSIRKRKDASFLTSLPLPAAGAAADSGSIDLEATAPGVTAESIEVEIAHPALASLADDKDLTIHLEDSADDSSFADISELSSIVSTGAGGGGAAAKTVTLKLPSDVKRYIRINAAVEAAGGDNTGSAATLNLLF
jgi:hypothetical protein